MAYKPFLIQKLKQGSIVRDSMEWGIAVKSFPFKLCSEMKEPSKRDWKDENGDDEFLPDSPVFKSYTIDVEFTYIGAKETGRKNVGDFVNYIINGGMFSIYDTYTGIGRTNVRYSSFKDDNIRLREDKDKVEFAIEFKVNDPITQIILIKP
ncbi:MAG: hypothetical protein RR319_07110 [Bacteroides sp.]